jgi:hypothetical protein
MVVLQEESVPVWVLSVVVGCWLLFDFILLLLHDLPRRSKIILLLPEFSLSVGVGKGDIHYYSPPAARFKLNELRNC